MSTTLHHVLVRLPLLRDRLVGGEKVGVVCFSQTPQFIPSTGTAFAGVTTVASLLARPEWVPIHSSANPTKAGVANDLYTYHFDNGTGIRGLQLVNSDHSAASVDSPSGSTGWTFTPNLPDQSVQEVVTAVAFYLVDATGSTYGGGINPVMFVTTQGVGIDTVIHGGAIYGQVQSVEVTGGNTRILTVDSSTLPPTFTAAHLILLRPCRPGRGTPSTCGWSPSGPTSSPTPRLRTPRSMGGVGPSSSRTTRERLHRFGGRSISPLPVGWSELRQALELWLRR